LTTNGEKVYARASEIEEAFAKYMKDEAAEVAQ